MNELILFDTTGQEVRVEVEMPYTKKQKAAACAVAHSREPSRTMPKNVAREMCSSPIKKPKGK